jgi:hypothetical protein
VGTQANRWGLGARVAVTVRQGQQTRVIHRVVGQGTSFGGNPLTLHVGLGQAAGLVDVAVTWPGSGAQDTWTALAPNTDWTLREEDPQARRKSAEVAR